MKCAIFTVPGVMGSQLEAKLDKDYAPHEWCSTHSDWYTVWVAIEQMVPLVIDCWMNNTRSELYERYSLV